MYISEKSIKFLDVNQPRPSVSWNRPRPNQCESDVNNRHRPDIDSQPVYESGADTNSDHIDEEVAESILEFNDVEKEQIISNIIAQAFTSSPR
ncbi:hypothetical protein HAX54_007397 [Datura stramonium]|uniref:Uncharacterized protein n=1 Tax=Datura stramonium TaxID=4076 RepID=A0ABS8RUU9_DATST|nr:hypothetical protein [Datura stramonium]